MTTVTAEQRLTIVKHLAAGKDLDWVAAATRFDRSVVLDIASRHGYPDRSKLAWARDVLAELGDMLAAERAKVEARRKQAEAKRQAREEVERLQQELAAARAKLRPTTTRPREKITHPCTVDGCDRVFDTSQGRSLHERRAHQGAES